jgi:hypothetical protein
MRYDYDTGVVHGGLMVGDLASSLAGINRYNAWTNIYWSVSSHACLVAEIIAAMADYSPGVVFAGLHHDDHEALTGDVLAPQQWAWSEAMQLEWNMHARRAQNAILRALGIWQYMMQVDSSAMGVVKAADIAALEAERRWLFTYRMKWGTEAIVNPKMLAAGERILAGDFARITGGPESAARYVSHHNALLQRMGAI